MSGGGLTDYTRGLYQIKDWALVIEKENPVLAKMMFDQYDLLHTYDYWLAGDYGEEEVEKAWKKFKEKWLNKDFDKMKQVIMARCIEIIDSYDKGHIEE